VLDVGAQSLEDLRDNIYPLTTTASTKEEKTTTVLIPVAEIHWRV
jgi:hypothetical protein